MAFLRAHGHLFDAIHASFPCQSYSPLRALSPQKIYPDFLADGREALIASGKPFVIENVMSAPLDKDRSVRLCGSMFGLRTYRHRRFEYGGGFALPPAPKHPRHVALSATKRRKERWAEGWNISVTGDIGTYFGLEAMGIDWMTGAELSEAIPPAYTRWVGGHLMAHLINKRDGPLQ